MPATSSVNKMRQDIGERFPWKPSSSSLISPRPALVGLMISQALTIVIVAAASLAFARLNRLASIGETLIEGKLGFRYTY